MHFLINSPALITWKRFVGAEMLTISEHLTNIYKILELTKEATVRKSRTVQIEGVREVSRNFDFYNLDVIISVG